MNVDDEQTLNHRYTISSLISLCLRTKMHHMKLINGHDYKCIIINQMNIHFVLRSPYFVCRRVLLVVFTFWCVATVPELTIRQLCVKEHRKDVGSGLLFFGEGFKPPPTNKS